MEQIVLLIKEVPLKDALNLLVAKGILDYTKKGYEKIKKIIRDKYNEGRYAFVPDKEEAKTLLEFSKNPQYKTIKLILPEYRYIDLIRSGLLINEYQKKEKNNIKIRNIKQHITRRPNGINLLKIVNLPTTPFFSTVIDFLYELKKQGYTNSLLEEKFNEIVDNWQKTSKFVKSADKEEEIISFCEMHFKEKTETFFMLGMENAGRTVEKIINKFAEEKYFEETDYRYTLNLRGSKPRKVEVVIFR